MKIELSPKHADAVEKIWERYYFGLFETIRLSEGEEYRFRDAIREIVQQIDRQRSRHKRKEGLRGDSDDIG